MSGSKEYEDLVSKTHYRSANRLLELCNANGGCFTKVGQHIGALDYLLPEEYTSTMKVLHSQAPKMDYEDIFAVLKEELGPDAENLFEALKTSTFHISNTTGGWGLGLFWRPAA